MSLPIDARRRVCELLFGFRQEKSPTPYAETLTSVFMAIADIVQAEMGIGLDKKGFWAKASEKADPDEKAD